MLTELWKEEGFPKDWEIGMVLPLFKKGDVSIVAIIGDHFECCVESVWKNHGEESKRDIG